MTANGRPTRRDVLRTGAGALAGGLTVAGTAAGRDGGAADAHWEGDLPDDAQRLESGHVAVPLRRESPSWVTEEVKRKTSEAADQGMAYDVANETAVAPTQYGAIRPGSWMVAPFWCTLNFMFDDGGRKLMGTAGHCIPDGFNGEDDVVLVLVAPGVLVAGEVEDWTNAGVGCDWATISFRKSGVTPVGESNTSARTAIIGGPGDKSQADFGPTKHIGHGIGMKDTARTGIYQRDDDHPNDNTPCDNDAFFMVGAASEGDSGSPVLTLEPPGSSKPVGILTHLIVGTETVAGTLIKNVDPGNEDLNVVTADSLPQAQI